MSKGNMLLGYARGSVGDVTFSRVKGNQVAKARNRHPSNPKTSKQVYQRAKFLNAVNFYKRGVQNLFKFAFEDRTEQESDFNAFMRHNVARAIPVGKGASQDPLYPAISNWLTSYGSLTGPAAVLGEQRPSGTIDTAGTAGMLYAAGEYNVTPGTESFPLTDNIEAAAILILSTSWGANPTLGSLSSALKSQYPDLMEGDIVTISLIHQTIEGIGTGDLYPTAGGTEGYIDAPKWYFCQFRIDSASAVTIADAITAGTFYLSDGLVIDSEGIPDNVLQIRVNKTWQDVKNEFGGDEAIDFEGMSSCVAAVMTFSRETTTGLKVSTQEFSTSYGYQQIIDLSKADIFTEQVLVSWDAADQSILEGSFVPA